MASNKRALCIGINNFENFPQYALRGCVNDANNMAIILKQYLGFTDSDIVMLIDSQATKKNIIDNLTSMLQGAKEGRIKYMVITLATHGTQIPDTWSEDEYDDRKDEVFCPYDIERSADGWNPDHIIIDDELCELCSQLPRSVILEVFFDTRHSATGLRDFLLDQTPRYIHPPSPKLSKELQNRYIHTLHEAIEDEGLDNTILWSGCLSEQTSADAKIDGTYNGAFSYNLVKQIRESDNRNKRSTILKGVRRSLAGKYTQIPQLECLTKFEDLPIGYSL